MTYEEAQQRLKYWKSITILTLEEAQRILSQSIFDARDIYPIISLGEDRSLSLQFLGYKIKVNDLGHSSIILDLPILEDSRMLLFELLTKWGKENLNITVNNKNNEAYRDLTWLHGNLSNG